jgi:glucokinase
VKWGLPKKYSIGIDLGGSKILSVLLDDEGQLRAMAECETLAYQGENEVIKRIIHLCQKLMKNSDVETLELKGIGIAASGVINAKEKTVIRSLNLNWTDIPIGSILEDVFEVDVKLINNANATVVAENLVGEGIGHKNCIYINVGTGIGAGIISNGCLIRGYTDSAGEFGHVSIDPSGTRCSCGNYGCLEMYASSPGLVKLAKSRLTNGEESIYFTRDESPIRGRQIYQAAKNKDPFALRLYRDVGHYLGIGITNLIYLFNPEIIILGGGVMNAHRYIMPSLRMTINERCLTSLQENLILTTSKAGREVGAIGAAGLFLTKELRAMQSKIKEQKSRVIH